MAEPERYEARLTQNPYDLGALIGALFEAAARGDFDRVDALRLVCEKLNAFSRLRPALRALARGGMPVLRRGDVFFTRIPVDAPAEALFGCIEDALASIGAAIGRKPPLLWIDFDDVGPNDNTICREAQGFCRLTLSAELFATDAWRPTIWHECGHALLMAHCRFLDEGWALWCQYRCAESSFFPVQRDEAMSVGINPAIAEIPLEGFLEFDSGDAAFRDIAESDDEQVGVYVRGYRLVAGLIDAVGAPALADAFEAIARGGAPLPTLTAMAPEILAADGRTESLAGADRAFRWLRSRNPRAGAVFAPHVRRLLGRAPEEVKAWEALGRMLASLVLNLRPGQAERTAAVKELEDVIGRLDTLDPANAVAEMLRGLHTISQIGQTPGALLMTVAARAEAHLQKAQAMNEADGDLSIALARMEMKRPFAWGADRASALCHLAAAARDPRCRWEAVSVASLLAAAPLDAILPK